MPDDPGPRLHLPRRALWVAPVTVLAFLAAVVVGIRVVGVSGGSQSAASPSPYVVTAPASSLATGSAEFEQPPKIGPALEPVALPCPTGSRPTLRVLQFNIHAGISQSGSVDLGRVVTEIRRVRPDLVSLNEVDSGTLRSGGLDEAAYLARATGLHAVYGPNLFYDGGLFGNAVLSRYPVVRSHNLALPTVLGLEPRGLLTATVRVGERTVSFSSVHLSDGGDGGASRSAQAATVARVVRHSSPPTIVAGDLNSQPADPPARILRQYLLDSQQQAGAGSGDTVPEQDPVSRFDYVLYDNRFAVVPGSTRVLSSAVSDHRSVFTELVLRPSGGC